MIFFTPHATMLTVKMDKRTPAAQSLKLELHIRSHSSHKIIDFDTQLLIIQTHSAYTMVYVETEVM